MGLNFLPFTTSNQAKSMSRKKCIIGLVSGIAIGGAIGTVMGLLFAPQSGKETRKLIKNKTNQVVHAVKNKMCNDPDSNMEDAAEV